MRTTDPRSQRDRFCGLAGVPGYGWARTRRLSRIIAAFLKSVAHVDAMARSCSDVQGSAAQSRGELHSDERKAAGWFIDHGGCSRIAPAIDQSNDYPSIARIWFSRVAICPRIC